MRKREREQSGLGVRLHSNDVTMARYGTKHALGRISKDSMFTTLSHEGAAVSSQMPDEVGAFHLSSRRLTHLFDIWKPVIA